MSDSNSETKPAGIFDRTTKGQTLAPVTVTVDRSQIRFFAKVLGEQNSIHTDVDAARAAGHTDLVAPPSFFMVVEAMADEERARLGHPALMQTLRCDFRRLLHGDEHYTYLGPIYAGQAVQFENTIVDFYEKKGGLMEFVTIESLISHAQRGPLVRAQRTLLHRLG